MARQGRQFGTSVGGETVQAFIPYPLPPQPALNLAPLQPALDRANQAIGRLDGVGLILPNPDLFIDMAVRKEALLSSQIEGTQSSLSDLLLFEAKEPFASPLEDVLEVSNYIAAMNYGLERLRTGFPLSLRLISEIHTVLLRGGRGPDKDPGEFRRSQNWIGGTRPGNAMFVPPPPHEVQTCLTELESFIHDERSHLPLLIRTALVHVQFETIHPFLDGNGRLGRLLITFMLCHAGALQAPLLYLSLYLKQHRTRYYELLQAVREDGAWADWLTFFLEGVSVTSEASSNMVRRMLELFNDGRTRVQTLGRHAASALRVLAVMERSPIVSISFVSAELGLSFPTASAAIKRLETLGLVRERSGQARGRTFAYDAYLSLLSEGTEPLRPG